MGLVPRFTKSDIEREFNRRVQLIDDAIILNLQYLGEECINEARISGSYTDQTGNLRSSVGYIIVSNGRVVSTGGFGGNYGKGGAQGESTGEAYAKSLAAKYRSGYALVVVAGMDYAEKVEANGKNVLSTAEHYAQKELPKMIMQLKRKIK